MNRNVRAGRITFCIVFFALLAVIGAAVLLDSRGGEKTGKAVYDNFSFLIGPDSETRIYGAYNPNDEIVYVTLPTYAQKTVRLKFNSAIEDVRLNESALKNKSLFEVEINKAYSMSLLFNGQPMTFSLCFKEKSAIPTLYIDMEAEDLDKIYASKENKEDAHLKIVDAQGDTLYYQPLEYIKTRGSISWTAEKKSFKIKLDFAQNLLSSKYCSKDWILSSNYGDRSFLRNAMTFEIAEDIGLPCVPSYDYVDLFINGRYNGLYLLCSAINTDNIGITDLEKNTKDANISLPAPDEIEVERDACGRFEEAYYDVEREPADNTGGYLLQVEKGQFQNVIEDAGFTTSLFGYDIRIEDTRAASKVQVEYIKQIFDSFERSSASENGIDLISGKHYSEIIDVDSWAKNFLLEEFAKDTDSEIRSNFVYKDTDVLGGLLYNAPVWDFGPTYGINVKTEGLWFCRYYPCLKNWSIHLYEHEEFKDRVVDIYENAYIPAANRMLSCRIDELAQLIDDSFICDTKRWCSGQTTYTTEIDALKEAVQTRMLFLNRLWLEDEKICTVSYGSDVGNAVYFQRVVKYDDTLTNIEVPPLEAEGYTFDGWYYEDHKTRCDGETESIDAEYLLLYAGWRNEAGELVFDDE